MTPDEALSTLKRRPEDANSWAALLSFLYEPLIAYVAPLIFAFRVEHHESARDIVHDVLLSFYQRWSTVKGNISSLAELRSYLKKSCRNLLIDRYRHDRRAEQMMNFLTLSFSSAFGDQASTYRTIFVDQIIRMLPEACGSLLRKYVETDLSPAELADREGAPPSTFYTRWYRCVQLAKQIFVEQQRR